MRPFVDAPSQSSTHFWGQSPSLLDESSSDDAESDGLGETTASETDYEGDDAGDFRPEREALTLQAIKDMVEMDDISETPAALHALRTALNKKDSVYSSDFDEWQGDTEWTRPFDSQIKYTEYCELKDMLDELVAEGKGALRPGVDAF